MAESLKKELNVRGLSRLIGGFILNRATRRTAQHIDLQSVSRPEGRVGEEAVGLVVDALIHRGFSPEDAKGVVESMAELPLYKGVQDVEQ